MNKHNAKDYLPLVQALAEGKTVQAREHHGSSCWVDVSNPFFDVPACDYRIKPEPVKRWYRVALMKSAKTSWAVSVESEEEIAAVERYQQFSRWLTDRIDYEV
jgi:hypothetical protein